MKKKVMCMLLTGMMAASMIAGCGNSGNEVQMPEQIQIQMQVQMQRTVQQISQQMLHQIRQLQIQHQQQPEILTTASTSTLYPVRWFRYKRSHSRAVRCGREK